MNIATSLMKLSSDRESFFILLNAIPCSANSGVQRSDSIECVYIFKDNSALACTVENKLLIVPNNCLSISGLGSVIVNWGNLNDKLDQS